MNVNERRDVIGRFIPFLLMAMLLVVGVGHVSATSGDFETDVPSGSNELSSPGPGVDQGMPYYELKDLVPASPTCSDVINVGKFIMRLAGIANNLGLYSVAEWLVDKYNSLLQTYRPCFGLKPGWDQGS